ncbi:MAG: glutathione peroxidase [Chloroflexia bacterium]|nr:glutathione peroxidase [Chloroflexia bacterium]
MRKYFNLAAMFFAVGLLNVVSLIPEKMIGQEKLKTFHDFKVKTLDGEVFDMASLKGKKVLVLNTASKCGFTPQYEILQKLYENLDKSKFEIIGFPANNFLSQEPGTDSEIKEFCTKNYGVTFPMMSKVSVCDYIYESYPPVPEKAKKVTTDEIYQWLTRKELNGVLDTKIQWNFQKFLIDENGKLMGTLSPKVGEELLLLKEWFEN